MRVANEIRRFRVLRCALQSTVQAVQSGIKLSLVTDCGRRTPPAGESFAVTRNLLPMGGGWATTRSDTTNFICRKNLVRQVTTDSISTFDA